MLEPPWYWGAGLPEYPGPSAARERALRAARDQALRPPPAPDDGHAWLTRQQELRALYARAWRDDVPEEDREWAQAVREYCAWYVNRRRRDPIARSRCVPADLAVPERAHAGAREDRASLLRRSGATAPNPILAPGMISPEAGRLSSV